MTTRPGIVMFLELADLDEADQPASREVTDVPERGERLRVSPWRADGRLHEGGLYEVTGREWQWDSSGRVRVVVYAARTVPPE